MVPDTSHADADMTRKVLKLIDKLEEDDDVQNVYSNIDIPEGFEQRISTAPAARTTPVVKRRFQCDINRQAHPAVFRFWAQRRSFRKTNRPSGHRHRSWPGFDRVGHSPAAGNRLTHLGHGVIETSSKLDHQTRLVRIRIPRRSP